MSEYILPDKEKLQNEYLIKYGEEFLKLNNLNIGDEVLLDFPYEGISTKYKSREMEKFSYKKRVKGILKLDEYGKLYAESLEDLQFYNYVYEGRRSYYKGYKKKSIIKFGTGFVL